MDNIRQNVNDKWIVEGWSHPSVDSWNLWDR